MSRIIKKEPKKSRDLTNESSNSRDTLPLRGSPAITCPTIRLGACLLVRHRHGASGAVRCGAVRYLPVCLVLYLSLSLSLSVCVCVCVCLCCLPTAQEAASHCGIVISWYCDIVVLFCACTSLVLSIGLSLSLSLDLGLGLGLVLDLVLGLGSSGLSESWSDFRCTCTCRCMSGFRFLLGYLLI
jgi:hypothetical protein